MLVFSDSKQYDVPVAVTEQDLLLGVDLYWVRSDQLASLCNDLFGRSPLAVAVAYPPAGDSYVVMFLEDGSTHKVWGLLSEAERGL